jgi:DNA-binding NarL/FixJ family response regulator
VRDRGDHQRGIGYQSPESPDLTHREREVLELVARGLTNSEIADRMVISPATAKTPVSRAMTKLGARDRAQLVVIAYESGLVAPARELQDLTLTRERRRVSGTRIHQ